MITEYTERECLICGFDRVIDQCHLIPDRIIKRCASLYKFKSFASSNIIYLCKNHHWLFDNDKLTDEEWNKILNHFQYLGEALDLVLYGKVKDGLVIKDLDDYRGIVKNRIDKYYSLRRL